MSKPEIYALLFAGLTMAAPFFAPFASEAFASAAAAQETGPIACGDLGTLELAEMSGIELYKIVLDIDWDTGRRQRELHFNTIRSILANAR